MAYQALDHAVTLAQDSRRFSELMARYCQRPELDALLAQFIEQKRSACRLLEESQERAYSASARA